MKGFDHALISSRAYLYPLSTIVISVQDTEQIERSTDMHDRGPPINVILIAVKVSVNAVNRIYCTHRPGNTPGILELLIASGSGRSQRSGFHSSASSPHKALFLLQDRIPMTTRVPGGTTISCTGLPSRPIIGCERGRMTSFWHL